MFAKLLNYGSWVFLTLFAIPSVLAVGSWNSLPGDSMYEVKLTMEQALLLVMSPSATAKGALHVKYTERRFGEAQKLIANKQSVQGLLYLEKEVASAKKSIEAAPKAERKQLARQYVATLRTVSNQLEQEKQHVQNVSPTTTTTTTTNTANRGNTQSSGSSGSTSSGGGTNTAVEQIDNTQNEIDDTIGDLEQLQLQTQMDVPAAPAAPNVQQQNEKGQGDEHRNENATQNQEEKKNSDEQKKENTQKDTNSGNSEHKDN